MKKDTITGKIRIQAQDFVLHPLTWILFATTLCAVVG